MFKNRKVLLICISMGIIIIIMTIICIHQHNRLMRERILNLNVAFYYMQEIVSEQMSLNFNEWEKKSAQLSILQSYTTEGTLRMGDYVEISNFIATISNIDYPLTKQEYLLLEKALEMRVSWSIQRGSWKATIIE